MENSRLDRVLGRGGRGRAKPKCQSKCERRRGDKPTAGERWLRDRANEGLHRGGLLLTARTAGTTCAGMESQAACQGVHGAIGPRTHLGKASAGLAKSTC